MGRAFEHQGHRIKRDIAGILDANSFDLTERPLVLVEIDDVARAVATITKFDPIQFEILAPSAQALHPTREIGNHREKIPGACDSAKE